MRRRVARFALCRRLRYRPVTMTRLIPFVIALSASLLFAAPASASPNWDRIAQCESGGNWHINTGNGFSGGLQWAPGTWAAYKPAGAPASAAAASRAEEIAAAERLFRVAGTSPWPVCGRRG